MPKLRIDLDFDPSSKLSTIVVSTDINGEMVPAGLIQRISLDACVASVLNPARQQITVQVDQVAVSAPMFVGMTALRDNLKALAEATDIDVVYKEMSPQEACLECSPAE